MNVYMTGLIYLTGCGEDVRAYAAKAAGHHASLWIEAPALDEVNTQWWPGLRRAPRLVDGVNVIEFVIPAPALVQFPGAGQATCVDLDDGLPKLRKTKKKKDGSPDQDFVVDPEAAVTNAVVEILGGTIRPRRAGSASLVEWITDPGVTITVRMKNNPEDSGTIALSDANADVIFANMHELPEESDEKDHNRGNHVPFLRNLNPDSTVNVYAVGAKVPGKAGQLDSTTSRALRFFQRGDCWCGNGTPCCCR